MSGEGLRCFVVRIADKELGVTSAVVLDRDADEARRAIASYLGWNAMDAEVTRITEVPMREGGYLVLPFPDPAEGEQ